MKILIYSDDNIITVTHDSDKISLYAYRNIQESRVYSICKVSLCRKRSRIFWTDYAESSNTYNSHNKFSDENFKNIIYFKQLPKHFKHITKNDLL